MKFYTFKRVSDEFADILKDPAIKKHAATKIAWSNHLMIGMRYDVPDSVLAYIVLKYGEDLSNPINKDFTPIPGKDYMPKKEQKVTEPDQTQLDNGV